jgi:hypothetical protein
LGGFSSGGGANNYRTIRDAQTAISVRNELKAMALLHATCDEHLSKYPTTYETDCEAITSGKYPPFSNQMHACIQVRGEKEVLLFYKDLAKTALDVLVIEDPQIFHDTLENIRMQKHNIIYQYVRSTVLRLRQEEEAAGLSPARRAIV